MVEYLKGATYLFDYISFTHVFKELNMEVDGLSKEGKQIEARFMQLEEYFDGVWS